MDYFSGDYIEFSPSEKVNLGSNFISGAAHFPVDDLLDFSTEDETMTDAFFNSSVGNSGNSSTVPAVESRHSSNSGDVDGKFDGNVSCNSFNWTQFSGNELCIPYDEIAELEWLSNFVEESFSTDDLHFLPVATTATATSSSSAAATTAMNRLPPPSQFLPIDSSVPAKARSKRSRAAPHDWSSRLLVLPLKAAGATDRTGGRKCLHCASEKTPQWRTGPMGPKTLCNACGVRFKSGRLVSEYRPAASPTFVSTKHSNSHRKVLELRRQKELQLQVQRAYAHQQPLIGGYEEILVHHRSRINGPDFRHV